MTATMKKAAGATEIVAIALLEDDHKKIKKMFKDFGELKHHEDEKKAALLKQICLYLEAHTKAEEKLFYPAVRYENDKELIDETDAEQERTIRLIARLEATARDDDHYDARVKAISEYIGHMKKQTVGRMPEIKSRTWMPKFLGAEFSKGKTEMSDASPS
jgi:hemerythrin superfamily protein